MGTANTLADLQHSGNNLRLMSPRKIMPSFGVIISATMFKNKGNTTKFGSTGYIFAKTNKQTQEDRRSEGQIIAPRRETRQRSDKLLTTLLTVKLSALQE